MKRQVADLLYVLLAILMALGAIAVTLPDAMSAKRSLEAGGLKKVRILSLIMPCRANGALHLYGVFFDAYVHPATRTNRACFNMHTMSWIIAGPFDGKAGL